MSLFIKTMLLIASIFFLNSCDAYHRSSKEVRRCIQSFDKLPSEDCLLRVKVGDVKIEFPLLYGTSLRQTAISEKSIHSRRYSPTKKRLAPYINAANTTADFLDTKWLHFSGHNIEYIASTNERFSIFKKRPLSGWPYHFWFSYISIEHVKDNYWPRRTEISEITHSFQACQIDKPWITGHFILKNDKITKHTLSLRYSLKIQEEHCGIQVAYKISDDVNLQFNIAYPAKTKSTNGWEEKDWVLLFESLDYFINSITYKENISGNIQDL